MDYPDIITRLPQADLPFDSDTVRSHMLASRDGLLVFFEFLKDFDLPEHAHGGQWGTVIDGQIEFTIGGVTRTYGPGDSYDIPSGTPHGARITAGTKVIDFFEEPDRYKPKR